MVRRCENTEDETSIAETEPVGTCRSRFFLATAGAGRVFFTRFWLPPLAPNFRLIQYSVLARKKFQLYEHRKEKS